MDDQLCPGAKPDRTWTLLYDPRHESVADGLQRAADLAQMLSDITFALYNHHVELPEGGIQGMWLITEMISDTCVHAARVVSQPGEVQRTDNNPIG